LSSAITSSSQVLASADRSKNGEKNNRGRSSSGGTLIGSGEVLRFRILPSIREDAGAELRKGKEGSALAEERKKTTYTEGDSEVSVCESSER